MEDTRSRNWCLLLYAEDNAHSNALELIKANYDYALILHDKDVDEKGEILKAHYHVVISFKNAIRKKTISSELGITENYIENCRNITKALRYLIHFDDDKFKYELDEVEGPLKNKLIKALKNDGKIEEDKAIEMIEFIQTYKGRLKISLFARYCNENGIWDVFRRASHIFLKIIEEHNNSIYDEEKAIEKYKVFDKCIYQQDIDTFLKEHEERNKNLC